MLPTNSKDGSDARLRLGQAGEAYVATWLLHHNYRILARNYHTRCGELDIIAQKGDILACIEVKMRTTQYFCLSQVVTPTKQRKMILTAHYYRVTHNITALAVRFDVALVHGTPEGFTLEYIENAFCPPDTMDNFCL